MDRKAGLLILCIAAAALAGCSANDTIKAVDDTLTAEQEAVTTSIGSVPELLDDGLSDVGGGTAGFRARSSAGPLVPIEPESPDDPGGPGSPPRIERRFWRVVTSVERSLVFDLADNDDTGRPRSAHVIVHKHLTGEFHVQFADTLENGTGGDSIVVRHVVKPLRDHWVRHVWLVRRALPEGSDDARKGWKVVAASGVDVESETSDEGTQPHIVSIRLQSGERDTTFSDPAAAIHWRELWRSGSGASVNVTVTTEQPNDVVVLVHRDHRQRLTPGGDNTYTGTWDPSLIAGLKHFGVNALSNDTLFDEEAGYHSSAWFFPFINQTEVIAADDDGE